MSHSQCSMLRESGTQRSPPRHTRHAAVPMALAIVLVAFCVISPAESALYKWTDANGRVVYSDQPPSGDVKVETIAGPPPPANRNAVKEMANKEAEGKKQQIDAAENAKKAALTRADAQKRAGMCRDTRAELAALSADQVLLYKLNEKGETVFMDDAERKRRRDVLESNLKTNCPPG
jgi:hypothetical protein